MKLSIKQKVEVRISLIQRDDEKVDEFYERCVDAQYVISDNEKDGSFDREVLLHFLFGLDSSIRNMVLDADCSTPEEFIGEARKYLQGVKQEPVSCNVDIKLETDLAQDAFENENEFVEHEDMYFDDELDNHYEPDENLEGEAHEVDYSNHEDNKDMLIDSKESKKNTINTDQDDTYFCVPCSKTYSSKAKFQAHNWYKHKKTKEEEKKSELMCQHCPAEFDHVAARMEHEEKIHNPISRTCGYCKEDFDTYKSLAAHLAYTHCQSNEMGKLVCIICSIFQRKNKKDVKMHILGMHFKCPNQLCKICNKPFDQIYMLQEHMRSAHTEGDSFQCDKCEKSFKTKQSMNRHFIVHHEKQNVRKCKFEGCEKTFANGFALSKHMQHHKKEPFVCDICGKDFRQKGNLRIHTIREHTSEAEQQKLSYKCEEPGCEFTAIRKDMVQAHVKRTHLKIRNHQCLHCVKSFFRKSQLEEHTNGVHLGLKKFKCDLCDFRTAYRKILAEHKKVTHGNQRFDCPYCNFSAGYKGNLRQHITKVHKLPE